MGGTAASTGAHVSRASAESAKPVVVIDSELSSPRRVWSDLWAYREMLYFLAWRDLKVRYRQTALGAAWAIVQPLLAMVVFSVFFGHLGRMPSDGLPYPLFAYAGLLPWSLFAHVLTESAGSVVNNQALITKVYFPRLIIPLAPVVVGLVDFAAAFVILLVMMLAFGLTPGLAILTLPCFVLLAVLSALAAGTWLAALNVRYRDVRYTIPFLAQFWLFASPVVYPASLLPEPWRTLYGLNPMAGVIDGFRWAVLGAPAAPGPMLAVSIGVTIVLLIGGVRYFVAEEEAFADVV